MNCFGFAPAGEGMLTESGWSVVHGSPELARGREPGERPAGDLGLDERPSTRAGAAGRALADVLEGGSLPGSLAGRVDEVLRLVAERHPVGTLRLVDAVAAAGPGGGAVVVVVERQATDEPTTDAVARRFGLTRRQAAVALLLARRRSNAEIAKTLAVSPHTARHHTERVLEKLGVSSRNRVAEVVFGGN